jgi:hypothetical protein
MPAAAHLGQGVWAAGSGRASVLARPGGICDAALWRSTLLDQRISALPDFRCAVPCTRAAGTALRTGLDSCIHSSHSGLPICQAHPARQSHLSCLLLSFSPLDFQHTFDLQGLLNLPVSASCLLQMFPAIIRGHLARKAQLLGIWLRAMLDTRERESCFLLTDVRAQPHSCTAHSLSRFPVLALMCWNATHGHMRVHRCIAGRQQCWASMLWLQATHAWCEDA